MTDLLLLALLALCLWNIQPAKPFFRAVREDCLRAESTNCLRGVLALLIVFNHLAQRVAGGSLFAILGRMGYLIVAVFFFLTGYGVQKQHLTRENYAKGFLSKRLSAVALPYLAVTGIYWIFYAVVTQTVYSLQDIWAKLTAGTFLVSFSWYIVTVLLFYGAFWVMMRLCGKKGGAMVLCGVVWYGLYVAFCLAMGYGSWWYISTFSVVIGMAWAVYQQKILSFVRKYYFPAVAAVLIGVAVMFVISALLPENSVLENGAKCVLTSLFAIFVVLLLHKIRLGNPALRFLGNISMEAYLMQGLAIMLWRSRLIYIEDDLLYCVLVVLTAVLSGLVLHLVFQRLLHKKPTR